MEGMENAEILLLEPNLDEVLSEGVSRLKERSTWKLWTWPTQPTPHVEQREFVEAEAFRQYLVVSGGLRCMVRQAAVPATVP